MKPLFRAIPHFSFPVAVFLTHIIASKVFDLYSAYPRMDIPFHFLGGVSIAYTTFLIARFVQAENTIAKLEKSVVMLLMITITATMTVFWEFAEFLFDRILETNIQISLANTMQDQFFGILGGLFVVMFFRIKLLK